MTRAIMNGCNGKMGQCITGICAQDEDIEIVAGIDTYDGIKNDYPVFASLKECTVDADVIIDFSNAKAVDALLAYGVEKQIPIVLCTTGLSEQQLADVEKAYEKVAILKSANMSLGINTLMELLKKAAQVFAPAGFDMEIVEKHHNQKLDAPSGTALALADSMNEALDEAYTYTYDRSQKRKKRDKYEIGLSSVRGGNIVGEHEVIFAGQDEVIEFKHTAYSKAVFVQHAKVFKKPGDAVKSMGLGFLINALMMTMVCLGIMTVSTSPDMAGTSVPTLLMVQKGIGKGFMTPLISILIILGAVSTAVNMVAAMVKRVSDGLKKRTLSGKNDVSDGTPKAETPDINTRKRISSREIIIALICCLIDFGIAQFGLLTLIQKAYSFLAYLAIPVILVPYIIHMIVTRMDSK